MIIAGFEDMCVNEHLSLILLEKLRVHTLPNNI